MLFYIYIFLLSLANHVQKLYANEFMVFGATGLSMSLSRLSEEENADLQAKCGSNKFNQPVDRIAGGTLAQPGQFPWAVSIASSKRNFCGGSLISDRHILTALHCFFKFKEAKSLDCKEPSFKFHVAQPESVQVHYGGVCIRVEDRDKCIKMDTSIAYIKKVSFANEFVESRCKTGDDFALIELDRRVELSGNTQPICLKNLKYTDLQANFSKFYDMGWGKDAEGHSSARLKFVGTNIDYLENNYLFARAIANPDGRRTSICIGDSGGPLIGLEHTSKKAVILGIHSSGDICTESRNDGHKNVFVPNIIDGICKWTGICPEK